jgi:hypothetical protein
MKHEKDTYTGEDRLERILDIILRELEGDDPAMLANDHGGTGLEYSEEVTRARKAIQYIKRKK